MQEEAIKENIIVPVTEGGCGEADENKIHKVDDLIKIGTKCNDEEWRKEMFEYFKKSIDDLKLENQKRKVDFDQKLFQGTHKTECVRDNRIADYRCRPSYEQT